MEGSKAVSTPPASPAAPQLFQFASPAKSKTFASPARSPAKHGTVGPRRNRCSRRVPVNRDPEENPDANPDANLHEALELVLAYEQDIRTLVKCTALNQHFRQYIHERAQQNARTLLASWKQSMPQKSPAVPQKQRMVSAASTGPRDNKLQCLLWLCRTAGVKFVNGHDVACSLLDVFRDAPGFAPERLAAGLKEAGFELTAALLVYACQAQLPDVPFLLRHLNHCPGLHAYKVLALQQKAGARPATEVLHRVRGILRHVTAANLPDLLLITLSYSPIETARDAASILLDHDRDYLHLLHTNKAQGVTGFAAAPAQPVFNSAEQDATKTEQGVDGIAYVQKTTSSLAVARIGQIMEACASSGSMETLYRLVKLPAAHEIGPPKVLELLPAIIKGPAPRSLAGFGLKMITSLPAAQDVSSDTIAALLEDAIANKVQNVGALLQLPEARLLGAKYAIDMVPKAVQAGLGGVAVELGRFAHGLEPDTADIVNLLKIIVSSPWCRDDWNKDPMQLMLMRGDPVSGGYSFHRCLMDFCMDPTGVILWDKLTGEDLLQLLEYCTSRGYTYAWHTLTSLPACVEITDAPRIIACFKDALQTATAAKDVEWPAHAPAVSRLRPSQFYDIMHCALQSPVHAVCESLLQAVCEQGQDVIGLAGAPRIGFPAAFAWPAGQLHELMCLAASVEDWRTVAALAHCPAAQQVTAEALTVMLQQLLSSLGSDGPARSEDESVAHAANLLQQMGAVLGGELRDVLGVGSAGSIRLASVHKEALLRLAALLPILHVQPEQLPQADSLESQPIIWAGVMYITTRMPAARQWSVESVQQALERALRNVQPNPAAKTEHNANSLQLMVFSNLMKLPARQMVSAASVQALLQHAQATGGVFKTPAVQNLLSQLPGYAEAVDKLKAAAVTSSDGTGSGSGSNGGGPVGWVTRRVGGVFGAVKGGVRHCARWLAHPMRFVLHVGRTEP